MENKIFELFNTSKYDDLENLILSDKNISLDIKDKNNNFFINYAINSNKIKLVKLALREMLELIYLILMEEIYYIILLN